MVSSDDKPTGDHGIMTREPGTLLAGRYRLDVQLAASDLGAVWRAEDVLLGRPMALRLLSPALAGDSELEPRLELRLLRNAKLPREELAALADLVDVVDLGRDERDGLFVVTEAHPSESLADELARQGPLPWPRLRALAVRACQLIHLSHEHGIIRQDLRTSSLYPVRDKTDPGTLKVVSPGLLIASGARVWACADVGVALALARYAAPEQISGGAVDRRTDVYALGVILYECLTGQVPFPDPRPAHVLAAHLITPPPPFPPAVRRRGVARELEAIVARALAKTPDERWPTVMALANAIAAIELGRCDASGVLETADVTDLTELLEPQKSATSMRVQSDRLSGKAGLAPAPVDAAATGEHAWRDILDAAESTSGLGRVESPADSDASDSAITRASSPGDSAPTLPYGVADDSAARWPTSPPPEPPPARPPTRRVAPWVVAAALSVLTAGVVTAALRPAARPSPPRGVGEPSREGVREARPERAASPALPGPGAHSLSPPVPPGPPASPAGAASAPPPTEPTTTPPAPGAEATADELPPGSLPASASSPVPPPDLPAVRDDAITDPPRAGSPRRTPARPRPSPEASPLPRKPAPGAKLPDPGPDLPDPTRPN